MRAGAAQRQEVLEDSDASAAGESGGAGKYFSSSQSVERQSQDGMCVRAKD